MGWGIVLCGMPSIMVDEQEQKIPTMKRDKDTVISDMGGLGDGESLEDFIYDAYTLGYCDGSHDSKLDSEVRNTIISLAEKLGYREGSQDV
jgi:hypothetical protein